MYNKHDDRRLDHDAQPYNDHNPFYGQTNGNNYNNSPYRNNRDIHNNFNGHRHSANDEDISRLKDAVESKTREVEHISGLLMVEKKRSDELEKRFKLSEAEKDRAFMQKQQFHDLLVEQKGRSSEMEEEISNLKVSFLLQQIEIFSRHNVPDRSKLRIWKVATPNWYANWRARKHYWPTQSSSIESSKKMPTPADKWMVF